VKLAKIEEGTFDRFKIIFQIYNRQC